MCADFAAFDCSRGRFAVADGVGVGWFSGLWAETLVTRFVDVPLVSTDLFEGRWWTAETARLFEDRRAPMLKALDAVNRQNAEDAGSHSTLLTLQFLRVNAVAGQVQILAIGDSCAFVAPAVGSSAHAFPFSMPDDFTMFPDTLSSLGQLGWPPTQKQVGVVRVGGSIVLATDAVSEWLLSWQERGLPSLRSAMDEIAALDDMMWPAYVEEARTRGMPRDDATALVVQLLGDGDSGGVPIGVEPPFDDAIVARRQQQFSEAKAIGDVRGMAAAVGDPEYTKVAYDQKELNETRETVLALDAMVLALRRHVSLADTSLEHLRAAWTLHASRLSEAPAAETLRSTLRQLGVLDGDISVQTNDDA
jgi:hypothetical protein